MAEFTVEVYGEPTSDWSKYYAALDAVPGTALIEDEGEPSLIFTLDTATISEAAILVSGIMATVGLPIVWGRAYLTEPTAPIANANPIVVPDFVPAWLENFADTQLALARK